MKTYNLPNPDSWKEICKRPVFNTRDLTEQVNAIMDDVRLNGDSALYRYAQKFDQCTLTELQVRPEEFETASSLVSIELKQAIQVAKANIEKFHTAQVEESKVIETMPGVFCWRKSVGIEKVGLYIPGGTAPLFSTILMLGIPAKIAGCNEILLCTPPSSAGSIHAAILFTAQLLGITQVYKVGGAQAIAAMCNGTDSIPAVSKIFGPGNQFVTKAKELAQLSGVAIDMPAGPSEVLVIADKTCVPAFVAADLLSQAEHGADSQVVLLSDDAQVLEEVKVQLAIQLATLPRMEMAQQALDKSFMVRCASMEQCFELSNVYAPEHVIIASENAESLAEGVVNAGSVFLGNYSCESAGDYASGTNHTLPTNGFAKAYSGVSVDSFVRKITFQKLSAEGIQGIGAAIETMAEAEELFAHKNAVSLRLKSLENG